MVAEVHARAGALYCHQVQQVGDAVGMLAQWLCVTLQGQFTVCRAESDKQQLRNELGHEHAAIEQFVTSGQAYCNRSALVSCSNSVCCCCLLFLVLLLVLPLERHSKLCVDPCIAPFQLFSTSMRLPVGSLLAARCCTWSGTHHPKSAWVRTAVLLLTVCALDTFRPEERCMRAILSWRGRKWFQQRASSGKS
jgi:hypothetical protein